MADYGMKISLPSNDITSNDPRALVLYSKYKNPKTFLIGTASKSFSNLTDAETNQDILTINYSLPYTPQVNCYWSNNSQYSALPYEKWGCQYFGGYGLWGCYVSQFIVSISSVQFQIKYEYVHGNTPPFGVPTDMVGQSFNFKYYLFIDQGA